MQTILCGMTGSPPEDMSLYDGLDHSRLTCEESTAYITVQAVQNMDAIAWARVNRQTRMPELVQHLQALNEGRSAREMDYDDKRLIHDGDAWTPTQCLLSI